MFDLITGQARHIPRRQTLPMLLSIGTEVAAIALIAAASVLIATDHVPEAQSMMAFVAAPPPPAPPPPPPPPAARVTPQAVRPVPTSGVFAPPVEAPSRIEPEGGLDTGEEGVQGGVEGGVPGGVVGGIVGGLPADTPPPPPPPVQKGPVRVGGEIKTPALVYRVEPRYPPFAMAANIQGTVILEAIIDERGLVQDVTVLRSQGLLDKAAVAAVRQWRYSPLLLNGRPERFILTVVLTFALERK